MMTKQITLTRTLSLMRRPCPVCKEEFEATVLRTYCSERCAKRAAYRRGKEAIRFAQVDTAEYRAAAGKRPRGVRDWRFTIGGDVFAFNALAYEQAEQAAQAEARERGVTLVTLIP